MNKKSLKLLKIVGLALIIFIVVGIGYIGMQKIKDQKNANEIIPNLAENSLDTSDWETYRDDEYGFEIKFPEGFSIDVRGSGFGGSPSYYMLINKNKKVCENKNQHIICQAEIKPFLVVDSKSKGKTLSDFIDEFLSSNEKVTNPKIITIRTGIETTHYDYDDTYIAEGNNVFVLFYNKNNVDYYQEIVNSLRFINSAN